MILNPLHIAEQLSFHPFFVGLFLAGVLTGTVFFVQSIANWFADRNSE